MKTPEQWIKEHGDIASYSIHAKHIEAIQQDACKSVLAASDKMRFALTEIQTHLPNIEHALCYALAHVRDDADVTHAQHELRAFKAYSEAIKTALASSTPPSMVLELAMDRLDTVIVDYLAGHWDSQLGKQPVLYGHVIANPTGSFRDAILNDKSIAEGKKT